MTLRLDCTKRNYELENLKHRVKSHRIALRDHPLASDEVIKNASDDSDNEKHNCDEDDSAATTITHKLGQADPLADFHKLEFLMLSRQEFETWEAKKLKIFA